MPVLKLTKYKYAYRNRYTVQGYRVELTIPDCTEVHKKTKITSRSPDPFAGRTRRRSPPRRIAGSGRCTTPYRRVLHRTNTLKKPQWILVPKNEMRPSPRRPSAGATPRAPWISEQSSLSTTTAAAGTSSPNQPPIFHKPSSHLRTSEAESRRPRHPAKATSHRRRTPVQKLHVGRPTSTGSPSVPEWSTNGARKNPRGLIPCRRRCRRLVDWKPRPRTPRTKPRPYPAS